jgi:integral membrane sensor domain MASE1
MSRPAKRRGLILWLAVRLAALGGILLVASFLVAFLVADHSSSDSSASSLVAIVAGALGYLALVVAAALLGVVAMARLWRRVRRPVRRVPGDR